MIRPGATIGRGKQQSGISDGRTTIHYDRANPRKRDLPVAIEIELEGPGKPREILIAHS
jgi:hypothetical protein